MDDNVLRVQVVASAKKTRQGRYRGVVQFTFAGRQSKRLSYEIKHGPRDSVPFELRTGTRFYRGQTLSRVDSVANASLKDRMIYLVCTLAIFDAIRENITVNRGAEIVDHDHMRWLIELCSR